MGLAIDLRDKVAIVTGAGSGIGEGVALAMAGAGAHVVCNARTARTIEDTAEKVRAHGVRALAVPGDVTSGEDLDRLVAATIGEFGRIDLLINNAGGTFFNRFLDISMLEQEPGSSVLNHFGKTSYPACQYGDTACH